MSMGSNPIWDEKTFFSNHYIGFIQTWAASEEGPLNLQLGYVMVKWGQFFANFVKRG